MFGRQVANAPKTLAILPSGVRPLISVEDLLKRAEWETLSDAEREALRAEFPPFPSEARGAAGAVGRLDGSESTNRAAQEWEASLMAQALHPEAADIIRTWLAVGAPGAHLYMSGQTGIERVMLVSMLARQALAQEPAPVDYLYVPEPSSMSDGHLLRLPHGLGMQFAQAIDITLRAVTDGWDDASSLDVEGDAGVLGGHLGISLAQVRMRLIAEAFALIEDRKFTSASHYVTQLRAAFEALARADADLPASYEELPTLPASVASSTPSDPDATPSGPPVVLGDLTRENIDALLLKANGGILILSAEDVITQEHTWPKLVNALARQAFELKHTWPLLPLTVRVVLVGDEVAHAALVRQPSELTALFRYEAWLSPTVKWTTRAEAAYAVFADGVAASHDLPLFDATGVSRLIEEGARRAEFFGRSHLTSDLLLLRDLSVEAAAAAKARGADTTTGADVIAVLHRRRVQYGRFAQIAREEILTGVKNTPTTGTAIGQINGLGVLEPATVEGAFAIPERISVTVSPNSVQRLLDIEHESEEADADQVRGGLTVEGYLAYRYGQESLLRMVARVRFEQLHMPTGGDSASGAVLFALLSALAKVPIRLSRAVTGAVGQYGDMQAIGGASTKIEGFWELCRLRREHDERMEDGYGVLIPAENRQHLMLRDEVAESIATEGWFSVWPVRTVDEALMLLTGVPAPEIHALVEKRLERFAALSTRADGRR